MALIIKDRVKETTTTEGTGTVTLAGASTGFRSFADIGDANTTYYTIAGQGTNEWEVGLGTYTASGTTLSRDTVLSNSLGTTALINFSAGTKDVFVTYPSGKAILGNTSAVASTGTGSVVLSDSPTITGNVNIGVSQYGNVGISTLDSGGVQNNNFGTSVEVINNIGGQSNDDFLGSETIFRGQISFKSSAYPAWDNCSIQMPLTVSGTLSATGSLQLTGSDTVNQNIATNQTSGNLVIGGTAQTTGTIAIGGTGAATGAITLGRSTGAQLINIGSTNAGISNINIGGFGQGLAAYTININRAQNTSTTNISNGNVISSNTKTVNIGTGSASSGSFTNINIGTASSGSNCVVTLNGIQNQQVFTVANLPTGITGSRAFVSNALAPSFGAVLAGGGGVATPVYHDGTQWRVG